MIHLSQFLVLVFKYENLKIAKFSTREIGDTCRFAKFDTREKFVFKKICESRNLITLRYYLIFFIRIT